MLAEHRRMFAALVAGDPDAAEQGAREHSLNNNQRIVVEPRQAERRPTD